MAETIYQLFVMKPAEAWYQLSKEEQERLLAKQNESLEKSGGKYIVFAESTWSNEEWMYFGVHQYPNCEALQEHTKRLEEHQWFRYIISKVILGTEWAGGSWEGVKVP